MYITTLVCPLSYPAHTICPPSLPSTAVTPTTIIHATMDQSHLMECSIVPPSVLRANGLAIDLCFFKVATKMCLLSPSCFLFHTLIFLWIHCSSSRSGQQAWIWCKMERLGLEKGISSCRSEWMADWINHHFFCWFSLRHQSNTIRHEIKWVEQSNVWPNQSHPYSHTIQTQTNVT